MYPSLGPRFSLELADAPNGKRSKLRARLRRGLESEFETVRCRRADPRLECGLLSFLVACFLAFASK